MSVKMIADKRRKPSRARQKIVKAEREAELARRLAEGIRSRFAIDPGVPNGVAYVHPSLRPLSDAESRMLNESLYGAQKMTDFDQRFGF